MYTAALSGSVQKRKKLLRQPNIYIIYIYIFFPGLYGVNKCILLHLIQLEYKKRSIDDQVCILEDYLISVF